MIATETEISQYNIETLEHLGTLQGREICIYYMQSFSLCLRQLCLVILSIVIDNSMIKVIGLAG
jgi:hypothetical protein